MADLPSTIGRYEVVSRLGQGGMGSLFLAKDPKIGRHVAIKLVRQEFDSPDARQRFAREAQAAGTLRHQNIVTIFDVDEHEGLPFIAMEYVDGQTLGEIVRRKAPIDLLKRLQWIEDLCGALAYAHRQGVIHRDIKPANLMVDTDGTLKILDFGLARRDAQTFTQTQTLIGTPNYMSPEQIKGGDIDARSDIFSIGSVLYEVLAYAPAFPGTVHQAMHKILNESPVPIETVVPGLDSRVTAVIQRALEKDVQRRYPDLTIMKHELAAARLPSGHDQSLDTIRIGSKTQASGVRRSAIQPSPARFSAESLQRRRNEQIEKKLEEARGKFEAGQIEKARAACEEALFIDPQVPAALRLMADITAEVEKRQVALWISDARMALAKGQLDAATSKANEALALKPTAPEVIALLDAIESATREQARARQIQELLKRARSDMADGGFESVVRITGEVLAVDPGNPIATELQSRARESLDEFRQQHERALQAEEQAARARQIQEALARARSELAEGEFEAVVRIAGEVHAVDPGNPIATDLQSRARHSLAQIRLQHERDMQAEALIAEARTLRDRGNRAGAIAILTAFPHAHDDVAALLASLTIVPAPAVAPPAAPAPPPARRAAAEPMAAPGAAAASVEPVPIPPVPIAPVAAAPVAPIVTAPPPVAEPAPKPKPEVRSAPVPTDIPSPWLRWRTAAAATVVLVAVVSVAAVMMGGGQTATPPSTAPTVPPATARPTPRPRTTSTPGATSVISPSRPVTDAVRTQNDDDHTEAIALLMKSKVDDAETIMQRIRKRDPNYEGLKNLEEAITGARELERAAGKKPG